ncbi:MAG: DNA mismatch repair endonuclease MutL [Phycisphaerae bacterium]|nr:DNA mismatch repair endonuclease MutL [Phycisphaerae bacterium]
MPQIHVLPDLLVNKIAAGEVIERPASVVKELIENSLDAGAKRIEVTIEQGGRKLIRVADDGGGMDVDDLALAVQPHATSKITREEDLFGIRTMGFRGEALPSIGAVSQLRIVSRQPSSDAAHEIRVTADRIELVTAASGPVGTTVEIRELFFNVPARQKFLRTPQTEMGHITEQLARIALVYPQIEFRLTHNGRPVHQLRPAGSVRERIADFFGKEMSDSLLEVARDERGLKIHGYVGRPSDSRSSARWQYFFLNGRYIRDRFVGHAVREAYRGLMEAHRYPVVFLALELPPDSVDVNVHPTKIEVRWRDSNMLYSQILSVIRDRFLNTDLTPGLMAVRSPQIADPTGEFSGELLDAGDTATTGTDSEAERRHREIRDSIADFFKRNPRPASPGFGEPPAIRSEYGAASPIAAYQPVGTVDPGGMVESTEPPGLLPPGPPSRLGEGEPDRIDLGTVLQVHRSYLVAETADGLVIIDQHALHERILFEQLSQEITRGPLESQRLLLPDMIDVAPDQVAVIEAHADTLAKLGFEMTPYGPSTIAVHAVPSILRPERVTAFVRDMLDRLAVRSGPATGEILINDLLSMMACKAAVKAGDPLDPAEIRSLLSKRHHVERSTNCPHGRPTSLRFTLRDLERQFKRV